MAHSEKELFSVNKYTLALFRSVKGYSELMEQFLFLELSSICQM